MSCRVPARSSSLESLLVLQAQSSFLKWPLLSGFMRDKWQKYWSHWSSICKWHYLPLKIMICKMNGEVCYLFPVLCICLLLCLARTAGYVVKWNWNPASCIHMKYLWLLLCCLDELLVLHIFLLMIALYNSKLKGLFPFPHLPTRFYFISFSFECFYFLIPLNLLRIRKLNPVILLLALNWECKPEGCKQTNEMQLPGIISCIPSPRYSHRGVGNGVFTLWTGYDLSQDSHGRIDNCYWRP